MVATTNYKNPNPNQGAMKWQPKNG
jgi:hypothetical protein